MIYFYAFLVSWLLVGFLSVLAWYHKQFRRHHHFDIYVIAESILGTVLGYATWLLVIHKEIKRIKNRRF